MRLLTLVGQMATGKSTVAAAIAARSGEDAVVIDLDATIVDAAGQAIAEIFAQRGEPGFRALERLALTEALAHPASRVVLATGGGTPCQPGAMSRILACGPVVWLDAAADVLAARAFAAGVATRPLLAGKDLSDVVQTLAEQRTARVPHYRRATARIDASAPAASVAAAVLDRVPWETPWP